MVEPATGLSVDALRRASWQSLGEPSEDELPLSFMDIVNQAGHHLVGMHEWAWLVRRARVLALRSRVSVSDGTWTEATLTLRAVGAFADYTWVQGDLLIDVGGTDTLEETQVEIAAKLDDDQIQLRTTISATGLDLATGDITATIDVSSIELPDDFAKLISLTARNSLSIAVELTDLETFLYAKTNSFLTGSTFFYATKVYATFPDDSGGAPKPILEIWPPLTAGVDHGAFMMFYQAGWRDLDDEDDYVPLPTWMHLPFIQLIRLMLRGYLEEDEGGMAERLMEWEAGPYLLRAMERDGAEQQHLGRIRGGIADNEDFNTIFTIGSNLIELGP